MYAKKDFELYTIDSITDDRRAYARIVPLLTVATQQVIIITIK